MARHPDPADRGQPRLRIRAGDADLAILGLRPGEPVRWRPGGQRRWRPGTVSHRERDGSIAIRDEAGAARSLPVDDVQVRLAGPRGGRGWEPLTARATRSEQLELFAPDGRGAGAGF